MWGYYLLWLVFTLIIENTLKLIYKYIIFYWQVLYLIKKYVGVSDIF